MKKEFSKSIHEQFEQALDLGITDFERQIPVVTLQSNSITIGANASKLPKAAHRISLQRHPSQAIRVAITSVNGLACPDPLPAIGMDVPGQPLDVTVASPDLQRHAGILILSATTKCRLLGAGFDDAYNSIAGMNRAHQEIFVAHIAGAALQESLK